MTVPQFHGCSVLNNDPTVPRIYELVVRQEPKQARMCGVGGKADRRPIDPPPIVQLRVIDPAAHSSSSTTPRRRRNSSSASDPASPTLSASPTARPGNSDEPIDTASYAQSFLQNPYYFMFACLARPDDDTELHWLKDGRTRCTTGSVVSSLYHLKDPQNNNEDAGFFVFPDLSVRTEGSYRLKLSLFEVVQNTVRHCSSIFSAPFYVYTAKKFPGMEESTPLSCSLADQGIKIRIRKDIRVRKRPIPALSQPLDMDVDADNDEDDIRLQPKRREAKRTRLDDGPEASSSNLGPAPGLAPVPQQSQHMPWPPVASVNSAIPPPPPSQGQGIPPPPKPGQDMPPPSAIPISVPTLPGPSVNDGRGGGYTPFDPHGGATPQPHQPPLPQGPPPQYRDPSQGPQPTGHMMPPAPVPQHPQHPPQQQPQQYAQPPPPPATQQPLPQHMPPPPPPQGYAPYPQWGGPPPVQPSYDAYYHHHQQHAPNMHPHYAAYPQQPMPPPPGRYDYAATMYPQQPPTHAIPQYGYYEQPPTHHQQIVQPQHQPQHQAAPPPPPPAPHQQATPHAAPPQYATPTAPIPPTTSPNTVPPLATHSQNATPGYDYSNSSYRAPTGSPQPRAPYPQAPYTQAYHMPPRHNPYPPPPPYAYPYAPPSNPNPTPTQQEWPGTPGFPGSTWDAYAQPPPNQPPQAQAPQAPHSHNAAMPPPSQPHTQVSPPSVTGSPSATNVVGNVASTSSDPVQLPPLLHRNAPAATQVASNGTPSTNSGYPVIQLRSSSRNGSTGAIYGRDGRDRDDGRRTDRDRDRDVHGHTDRHGGHVGKKNPLSIGSIISGDE